MEHTKQWEFLEGKFKANQLSHAYIFSGQEMSELVKIAKKLVALINSNFSKSSEMIGKNMFPDLMVIDSSQSKSSLKDGEDKQEIDISLIRQVQQFLSYKPYYGDFKTVIIENAERMNVDAADCFLKNLEEPKGKTLILLLSQKPEMLLPTIASRCQKIKFENKNSNNFSPDEQKILKDLIFVLNADLAEKFLYAKNVAPDNVKVNLIFIVLQKYFRQLLLSKIGFKNEVMPILNKDYPLKKLKKICELIEKISHNSLIYNSSPKLALEVILLEL